MKRKVAVIIAIAFAAVALLSGVALAQNAPAGNQSGVPAPFQVFLEKLAANLGVEQGKLMNAIKQTELQMVDEAVQQGKLTSDQAQKIKDRIEQGRFFPMGLFHGSKDGTKAGAGKFMGKQMDVLAQILGMSADELKTELQQGKKISDIAQEKGLTMDQLHQKLLDAKIQAIQQAVKDGKIPKDKADKLIQRLQNAPQDGGFEHFGPPAPYGQTQ
ncbi:CRISPR/Cas system-associated endoribonuclease Cas2 [Desulfofundulus luciae]|uniref:CRISPR/Cas system-associated endoribonuclease Cas2 n=1 Tax=Desulfofundulus luciae TaxID=74702 RepID=A0ABU0B292_9FIRM|nr:hypothetical protein [Desulfofundulus luciae]MDQ0286623.1 CRISPR/Cas system-associated endoribonuclease Cas2 [Desulfofundulus luciae]